MNFGDVLDIFAAIVVVAGITAVVQNENSARVIEAWGDALSGTIRSALGN